jgi:hypothetical protein
MKNNQRKNILIWFSKTGFHFYWEGASSILMFPYPADSVRYFDISDELKFLAELEAFLKQNNIENVTGYFIVDQDAAIENYFVKNNEKVLSDFIENIPYEQVISKVTEKGDSMHVIGFNGSYYHLLSSLLEKRNSSIAAVLPYILMPQPKLDIQNGQVILKKAILLKNESMIDETPQTEGNLNTEPPRGGTPVQEKSVLPYLLPVFLVLVGVLVYLLLTTPN